MEISKRSGDYGGAAWTTARVGGESAEHALADRGGAVLHGDAHGAPVPSVAQLGHARNEEAFADLEHADGAVAQPIDDRPGGQLVADHEGAEEPFDLVVPVADVELRMVARGRAGDGESGQVVFAHVVFYRGDFGL